MEDTLNILLDVLNAAGKKDYRALLVLCRWDEGLAERLIAAEIRDRPGLSRKEAVCAAKERLEADRR